MTARTPEPGLVLAGRYRLEEKLGEGGMGTVWRAEHLVLCAPVAVKVLDRDVSRDPEAHDRFIREARSAATLRSPHVVQTLDYGIDEGYPFIAMELLEGETLATRLTRQSRLSPMETARIITHVARAVGRAHEAGIIHRDLKPENVFIVKNEDAEISKVLDFGVAKVETAALGPKGTRTRTGSLLGTPFYMSPEQAQGNKTIDPRSDLWALGVIAFECLTGKRPFESEGLGDLVLQICVRDMPKPSDAGGLPDRFDEWFNKACARDPEDRFQTARELAEALREVVGAEVRDTMATFGDEELPSIPRSVVVRSGAEGASSGMEKTISSPRLDDAEGDDGAATSSASGETAADAEATAANVRKPSLTVRQFGTTQSSVPERSNRTALLLGVGGLALVVGLGAGFYIMRGGAQGLTGDAAAAHSGEDPTAEPSSVPPPSTDGDAEAASADAPEPDQGDAEAEATDAAPDAGADAAADVTVQTKTVGDDEEEEGVTPGPRIVDASTDRDWGKVEDLPAGGSASAGDAGKSAATPSSDAGKSGSGDVMPKLPPPPPPLPPD